MKNKLQQLANSYHAVILSLSKGLFRKIILGTLYLLLGTLSSQATSYTWNGDSSTTWSTAANWTPNAVPTSTDNVTIVTTSHQPQLSANTTVAAITVTSGTLDLNTYSLTVNGNATFNGGTLAGSTGTLIIRGGTSTFAGTSINPSVDVIVNTLLFNGSTFNGKGYFETTTNVPGTSNGGCTFNDSITIKRSYTGSGIMYLANSNPNTYNGAVAIINNGTKEIQVCNAGTSYFYENLTLENTSSGGIWFGSTTGGGANLDSEKEILIGSAGFSAGTLLLRNITTSNTSWGITLTGTAILNCISSSFADVNTGFTAPSILLKDNLFFGITTIEQNGSVNASWSGGNTFYDNAFITNSGTGILRLDIDNGNHFQNNLTLYANTHEIKLTNTGETIIQGNLNAQTAYVNFISGTGTLTFGGANQNVTVNSALKNVKINSLGGNLTLSTPATIIGLLTLVNGKITSTSTNLLTLNATASVTAASDSSFVSGPVKKIGNSAFVFPTGKGSDYRAVEISAPSSSTDAFTCEYFDEEQTLGYTMDSTLNFLSGCNNWNLVRNNGSTNVIVKFSLDTTACDWKNESPVHIGYWNGTKWVDKGEAVNDGYFKKINTAFTSYGKFTFSYFLPDLSLISVVSGCNLKYAQATVKLFQRQGSNISNGVTQPVSLTLPVINGPIRDAFLFFTLVSSSSPPGGISSIILNSSPVMTTHIRWVQNNSTCWSATPQNNYNHTASYAARLPVNLINTNGSANVLSGLPVSSTGSGMDTYGACLFVIYQDQCGNGSNDEFGFIDLSFGLGISSANNLLSETLNGYTPYTGASLISSTGFMIVGDYETATTGLQINSNPVSITPDFYNFVTLNGVATTGAGPTYTCQMAGNDCVNLSVIGHYYNYHQATPCNDFTVTYNVSGCPLQGNVNINLNVTPVTGVPYTFQWSNSSTTQNLTNVNAGIYTVTVTNQWGCTKQLTVNLSNVTAPPSPTITGTIPSCQIGNNYNVTNANAAYNYTWSASTTQTGTGTTASGINWQQFNSGNITFTALDPSTGCSSSSTFQVYACCDAAFSPGGLDISNLSVTDLIANPGNFSPYYTLSGGNSYINMGGSQAGGTNNDRLVINGTFTVDRNLTITTSEIVLGPQAQIIVQAGYDLSLEACWLHACNEGQGYMWDGIYASDPSTPSGGQANTRIWSGTAYSSSYIEDAENGIVVNGNVLVALPVSNFNNNYRSLQISNYPWGKQPTYMFGVRYSCVANPYNNNPLVANGVLLPPHQNERPYSAIELDEVNEIDIDNADFIGSSQFLRIDIFNMENGILARNSSVNLRAVDFQFINTITNNINEPPYLGFLHRPRGLAVGVRNDMITNATNYSFTAGLPYTQGGLNPQNTFLDCSAGIYTQGRVTSDIRENVFNRITSGVFNTPLSITAINIVGGFESDVNIEANQFWNFNNGINILNRLPGNLGSNVNITRNQFNMTGSGIGLFPIRVESTQNNNSVVTIAQNQMERVGSIGISIVFQQNALVTDNNPIEFNVSNPPTGRPLVGIHVREGSNNTISLNRIENISATPTLAFENTLLGINIQRSIGNNVESNHVLTMGTGIRFFSTQTQQTVHCNDIDQNYTGVRIELANIGNQVNAGNGDQNNLWTFIGGAIPDRGIVGYLGIAPSVWYCPNCSINPTLLPTQIPNSNVTFNDNNDPLNCNPAPPRQSQSWLVDIAYEQNYGDTLSDDEKYYAKKQVYYLLASNDSLMLQGTHEDTLLRAWFDSTASANIGLLKTVTDSINLNTEYAAYINESITPANHSEENELAFNAIYLVTWAIGVFDFTTEQYETLYSIAIENPITGGSAVYSARVMLGLDIDEESEGGSRLVNTANSIPNPAIVVNNQRIKLMPNPAKNEVRYFAQLLKGETGKVSVYSQIGIKNGWHNLTEGINNLTFNLRQLTPGIYVVETIINDKSSNRQKLVVIK